MKNRERNTSHETTHVHTEEERRRRRREKREEKEVKKGKKAQREKVRERERERNCVSTRLLFVVYSQLPFIPHLFPTLNIHIALERAIIHNGLYRTFL